jgi:hypothetical protein
LNLTLKASILSKNHLNLLNEEDLYDFNIEGYFNVNFSKMPLINKNDDLMYDQINVNELTETNQEYKYYFKYFYGHVY